MSDTPGERVAKVIARAGLCSRREAEALIEQGRVFVNGQKLHRAAHNVGPADEIVVDGKKLAARERPRLFRFNKPREVLVAARDPQGRPTIYDGLPGHLPRLMPVGRLDFNSEGLLLLTNDGAIKRHLELPASGLVRRYRVRVFGSPDPDRLARLKNGISIDGVQYGSIDAAIDGRIEGEGRNNWLVFKLTEGKNREVRRVCEQLGLQVNRLIRTDYGAFSLEGLPRGAFEEVGPGELRKTLGALAGPPQKKGPARRMTAKLYFEDLVPGRRFESASLTVTADMVRAFAGDFDPQPFHLDENAARDTLFGGLVASGWHTAALTMRLIVASLPVAGGVIGAGAEVAWPKPLRAGETIRLDIEILELRASKSKPHLGFAKTRVTTLGADGSAVQTMTANLVVPRRDPAAGA